MAPQDSYIEEEDELCPLCIEEFDLQDRFLKPCPCGYQICQFCFNNIRQNVNNLCPACRRPYDDSTIEWRKPTAAEVAEYEARKQSNNKKRVIDQRQKETQHKRDQEKDSRKSLVGVRVVQKNLVYVTGLTPTVREDELLKTLRKHEFFGQYGNIHKISISNRKSTDGHNQSLGIYVTFEKKEDAARCIQAVNGSVNGDRTLRAQLGTTKYCSAWLRHETCNNRQCMFLHELGDEEDSYSRQDLSSMNSLMTNLGNRGTTHNTSSSRSASRQQVLAPALHQTSQPMAQSSSKDGSDNGDGSALPISANWARNPAAPSRRGSQATSGTGPSPVISNTVPQTSEPQETGKAPSTEKAVAGPSTGSASTSRATTAEAKNPAQSMLNDILKRVGNFQFPAQFFSSQAEDDHHPPLFDLRGGEKRRALREEDDTRLGLERDEVTETHEAVEGEAGRSGSLALGGEPEDRGHVSGAPGFDVRRGPLPPIQRANAEGLFGPSLAPSIAQTSATLGPLGSIGSRIVTTQQHGLMRPQSGFVDNMPPGLASQANLFQGQGQGHVRQGSRYSFANENRETASSTTVKLAANARNLAQQTAMMTSSFQQNMAYGSSIAGPPPGIKSTGTPPNLFGQHGFGSTFGNMPKDSNDLLSILNTRARGANNQVHDAGKREFRAIFPPRHPASISSTPVPPSSFTGSLHGSQPGAFPDDGSMPKKKGKKHRHADTSSSGGSGLVDLADPSILQARMQHQQQSNAGVGQGGFGGQAQEDDARSINDEDAINQVNALVSDDSFDSSATPTGFRPMAARPGLTFPQPQAAMTNGRMPLAGGSRPRQTLAARARAGPVGGPVPSGPSRKTTGPDARKHIKALAIESGLSKDIAASRLRRQKLLHDEDFPALDAPKPTSGATPLLASKPAIPSRQSVAAGKRPAKDIVEKVAEPTGAKNKVAETPLSRTRRVPDALNVCGSTATEKTAPDKEDFPALATPSTSVTSPLSRAPPKTLRVISTPKSEAPPVSASASTKSAVAAMAGRPETPVSENVSDTASIMTASMSASRSNSPPPSRVGTAPVRATTKSQVRKQRKEASKKDAVNSTPVTMPEAEVEIAPIVGRMKKQKKEKEKEISTTGTPATSGPASPAAVGRASLELIQEEDKVAAEADSKMQAAKEVKDESSTYRSLANETTNVLDDKITPKVEGKGKGLDKLAMEASSDLPTPQSAWRDLVERGLLLEEGENLACFKQVTSQSDKIRPELSAAHLKDNMTETGQDTMTSPHSIISEEEQAELMAGNVIRKVIDGVRIMLTPNFDCVRNLSEEEEDKFLAYQQRIAQDMGKLAAFTAPRHESTGGFSLVKGRAVPNGPPAYFPQPPSTAADGVNKMQREEAIYYINQCVLPRLNLGTTPQKMGFPGSWKSAFPDGKVNVTATAASLNSMAPWIYGNSAAAAAAAAASATTPSQPADPELSYPGPVGAFAGDSPPSLPLDDLSPDAALPDMTPLSSSPSRSAAAKPSTAAQGPFAAVPFMSVEDAEAALNASRKETEKLEKSLNQLIRRNRRLLLGNNQ